MFSLPAENLVWVSDLFLCLVLVGRAVTSPLNTLG